MQIDKQKQVSVIIAAKNEESRIGRVLRPLSNHPLVGEVIVVCDGCEDKTAEVARSFGAHVHTHKESLGKTLAVKYGLKYVHHDIVLLLDADLVHLTADNVTALAEPVINDHVDFTLSVRGNSSTIYKIFNMDFVSGERAIRKELLDDPKIWSKPKLGYGLEVLMNRSFLSKHKSFISVYLPNLYATPKHEKMYYWKGVWSDFSMVFNIFQAMPFYMVGIQFLEMVMLSAWYRRSIRVYEDAKSTQ